mmetsp:Transcript_82863/g.230158  ORF Transcript_82863/g.230158 Transcript_82863/m.230158 type:complete len:405 (+) Transcript_82863:525-1739(+)
MHIHRVLELLLERLCLGLLAQERLVQVVDLPLQAFHVCNLGLCSCHVVLRLADLGSQVVDLLHALVILDFTLLQGALLYLDLLIEQCQLLVSADELRSQDVPLADDTLQLLLLLLALLLRFLDGAFQFLQLRPLRLDYVHEVLHPALRLLLRILQLFIEFLYVELAEVAVHEAGILLPDFLLQGRGLVKHDFELPPHLVDLLVGLDKILGVQVPVRAHSFVQGLLQVALGLDIRYLLLQFGQLHTAGLQLLLCAEVLGVCLREFDAVLLALLLEIPYAFPELVRVLLPPSYVLLHVHRLRLLPLHQVDLLLGALICLDDVLVQDIALPQEVLDLFPVDIAVALQGVRLILRCLELLLEFVTCCLHLFALFIEGPVLLLERLVHLQNLVLLRTVLLDVIPPCTQS